MGLLTGQAEFERQMREMLEAVRCVCCAKSLFDCRCTPAALDRWAQDHPVKVRYRPMRT